MLAYFLCSQNTGKAFVQAGAEIVEGNSVWQSEIILKVNAPLDDEIALLNPGTTLVTFLCRWETWELTCSK